jgi:hypothetical protein
LGVNRAQFPKKPSEMLDFLKTLGLECDI